MLQDAMDFFLRTECSWEPTSTLTGMGALVLDSYTLTLEPYSKYIFGSSPRGVPHSS